MGELGQVIKTDGDTAMVRLTRTEACAGCKACTVGLREDEMIVAARNLCGARADDWVTIELENANFLLAAGIMYGIPLVALLVGIIAGFFAAKALGWSPYDAPVGFCAGFLLMACAYRWIHAHEERWRRGGFVPVAVERVDDR